MLECSPIGQINKILIGHDNKGFAPGWFLDRVVIEDITENHTYEFPCNRWLAKNEDDKQIARILVPKKPGDSVRVSTPIAGKVVEDVMRKKINIKTIKNILK
jgi:hypothetical protein